MHKALVFLGVLAGCSPLIAGGDGRGSDGRSLAGVYIQDPNDQTNTIQINSPSEGWSCQSKFPRSGDPTLFQRTVPLVCSDGRTGTAALSADASQAWVGASFRLNDGLTGQVRVPLM